MNLPELIRRCENPTCPQRGRPWRFLRSSAEGLFLNGRWHCSSDCFEEALTASVGRLLPATTRLKRKSHRIPLGLILLSQGLVNEEQLRQARQAQREAEKGRLGDWLRNLGTVTEMQITQALARQWGVPVFLSVNSQKCRECAHMVPFPLLEKSQMVPVHFLQSTRQIYLAFAEMVDDIVLYAVEQMVECRTEPCLAPQSSVRRALDEMRNQPRPQEIFYEVLRDPQGWAKPARAIAKTVRRHAEETGGRTVQVVSCGEFLWLRLTNSSSLDLLFQIVPAGTPAPTPSSPPGTIPSRA